MAASSQETERAEVVKVRERLPEAFIKAKTFRGDTWICVKREKILEVVQLLKDDPDLQYGYFSECLGVDYSKWEHERDLEERFEVVYNLMSLKHNSRIFVKIGVNDGQTVPTLKHLFLGAEYPERETQDLFGIPFEGNAEAPGMRFMLPDDWIGYPLRKEVPLGGDDVLFDKSEHGPAVEDISMPHAGESFEGKTGTEDVGGR